MSFFFDCENGWTATNIGNGPALRIVVAHRYRHEDSEWAYPTRFPDMPTGAEVRLGWLGKANVAVIGASYEDFTTDRGDTVGNAYTTICANDENRMYDGRALPSWQHAQIYPKWRQDRKSEIVLEDILKNLESALLVDRGGNSHARKGRQESHGDSA
ncbi:hypothetical protein [Amycolatopsis sp. WGS_07]|uniref:hypothetical protein n=1 Tax=Amycolatopsis sp. WGS_07 TaxID=3076764 RepID=UPI0038732960